MARVIALFEASQSQPRRDVLQQGLHVSLNTAHRQQGALRCFEHAAALVAYEIVSGANALVEDEDRGIFSDKLNEIGERIAPSFACDTLDEALEASKTIGFPCMVRCAFALGGLGSALIDTEEKFEAHCREAFASTPQALAAGCGRHRIFRPVRNRNSLA